MGEEVFGVAVDGEVSAAAVGKAAAGEEGASIEMLRVQACRCGKWAVTGEPAWGRARVSGTAA